MKVGFGVNPYIFPQPVLMVATYGENDCVDVMAVAWGGICAHNMIALNVSSNRKTVANIRERGAFTVSAADVAHLKESDYFGTVSGNFVKDKFEKSGLHAEKSSKVDAPVVMEYPVTLECKLVQMQETSSGYRIVGEIVNSLIDESVLDEQGKVDVMKLGAVVYDHFNSGYYAIGQKVGQAWSIGKEYI